MLDGNMCIYTEESRSIYSIQWCEAPQIEAGKSVFLFVFVSDSVAGDLWRSLFGPVCRLSIKPENGDGLNGCGLFSCCLETESL